MDSGKTNPHDDIGPREDAPDDLQSHAVEEAASTVAAPGSDAISPLRIPRKAWLKILKRVYTMWGFHNLSLLGAGMAFFTFLAITPLLAATVMIYGLIGDVATVQRQMRSIYEVLPADAARIVESQMMAAVTTSSGVTGIALLVALVFAIYGGMRAANGFIGALNVINEEHESRNIIHLTLRVMLLTMAAIGIAITGVVSGGVFAWMQGHSQEYLGHGAAVAFQLLAWVSAISLGSFGFAMMMRYGPDRRPARWRWLAPGAICATLIWLAISFGFSFYVSYISDYNATYGSLSAIVVFLMWLFLSAYGVLFGALLNAEVERHTSVDSTIGPAMPRGQRGAVLADITEGDLSIEQWLEKTQRRAIARQLRRRR